MGNIVIGLSSFILGCIRSQGLLDRVFFFTGILARPYQNSGTLKKKIISQSVILFHRNFSAIIPKFRHFENFIIYYILFQFGWPHVIASREANDGVVPLTCLTCNLKFHRLCIFELIHTYMHLNFFLSRRNGRCNLLFQYFLSSQNKNIYLHSVYTQASGLIRTLL